MAQDSTQAHRGEGSRILHVAHVSCMLSIRHKRDAMVYALLVRYCHRQAGLAERGGERTGRLHPPRELLALHWG